MTKDELKKEAEEYAKENFREEVRATARNAYLDCAKLKEKRIAELEKENAELKSLKDVADLIRLNNSSIVAMMQLNNNNVTLRKKNAELEQKYSKQADDFENMKAGLESEIKNLKTQIHKMKCCANCGNNHDCQLKGCRCNNHIGYPFWKVM